MAAKKDSTKKPFPFNDGQPSDNAAIRVIRMVKPECPIDPTPEIRQRDGSYRPNPRYTGEQNCMQLYKFNNYGKWDVAQCEALGHDPWHTVFYRRIVEDIFDPETGEFVEQKVKMVREKRINIIAVSLNIRHTSGTEQLLAAARGCLTLSEYGERFPDEDYEDPCEFRSCTQKVKITTRFGNYCGERHARLVAADQRGIMRFVGIESDIDEQWQQSRAQEAAEELERINIAARDV